MTCPNCRGQIADGSTFCGLCGTRLNLPYEPEPVIEQPAREYQPAPQDAPGLTYPDSQPNPQPPVTDPYAAAYSHPGMPGETAKAQDGGNGHLAIGIIIIALMISAFIIGGFFIYRAISKKTSDSSVSSAQSSEKADSSKADKDDDSKGSKSKTLGGSMLGYVSKSKKRTANTNAKIVFTTVSDKLYDLIAEGESFKTGKFSFAVKDYDASDPIEQAIYDEFSYMNDKMGEVYFEIDEDGNVKFAQWRQDSDSVAGQYPLSGSDEDVVFGEYSEP